MTALARFQKFLRRVSTLVLPLVLILIAVSLLVVQFREVSSKNEILSLSSFVVLISFSGLAFAWARVPDSLVPEAVRRIVYYAGIDLFLAALLALVATFFAWLQTSSSIPTDVYPFLFAVHWAFLFLALLLFLITILLLLGAVRSEDRGGRSGQDALNCSGAL